MPIKSFRGLIADGGQDTITLHTNNGSQGYRIKKFEIIDGAPGTVNTEIICKIYSVAQTAVDALVDFSDQTLLGAAYYSRGAAMQPVIIFDNITFNQDIYVTQEKAAGGDPSDCNYHIELELIKLDLSENTVATLKDIRNIESQ
tara:strand:+ start:26 stop:457 length:432 start_codon:yes stop_codon:yes gene_type:complete